MKNQIYNERPRALAYVIEFVKFTTGFVVLITVALFTLHLTSGGLP